jgi:hypothetical protein
VGRNAALIEALATGAPHELVVDIAHGGDAFQNA